MGRGGRRKNERTACQRIVSSLASRATGAPPSHLALGSLVQHSVRQEGCRFMAAWVKKEEKASEHRQRKREAEEADKVEVALGVTLASWRRFRATLIGPI